MIFHKLKLWEFCRFSCVVSGIVMSCLVEVDVLSCVESQSNSSVAIPWVNCTMNFVHGMSMWVIKFSQKCHWGYWCPHSLDHWRGISGNTKMFTESKVVDNSENGHGYMVTSLMTGEHDGTLLTKFLKQVVFLLLGICLSLLCL